MLSRICRWYLDVVDKPHKRQIFSIRFRYYLWSRDRGRCQYCGKTVEPDRGWHIEHIIPYSAAKDWPYINDEQNLVVACIRCNMAKGTRLVLPKGYYQLPPRFWRMVLKLVFKGDDMEDESGPGFFFGLAIATILSLPFWCFIFWVIGELL